MKRLMITAAALMLLTTKASAQLLLPPAPATPEEVQIRNMCAVAVYASTCKHSNPDYLPEKGKMWGVIWGSFNDYPLSYVKVLESALAEARQAAAAFGSAEEYCRVADRDEHMQRVIRRLEDTYLRH